MSRAGVLAGVGGLHPATPGPSSSNKHSLLCKHVPGMFSSPCASVYHKLLNILQLLLFQN